MSDAIEPPLKKFKSLFEESDPDRIAKMSLDEYGSQRVTSTGESLTEYEPSATFAPTTQSSRSGRSKYGTAQLGAVMEEAEESTQQTGTGGTSSKSQTRSAKRKSREEDEDVELEDDKQPRMKRLRPEADEAPPMTLAPAVKPSSTVVTRVNMAQSQVYVKPKPPSKKTQPGKLPGEPDKDAAFLKAVASTKRGKKAEDTFDREFNNLKISKPDLERDAEQDEWKVLEDFGDDESVRGNFMVVVEMPLFREERAAGHYLRRGEGRLEWQGRPDFKKFRRVS